jgi:hypothetical protein
MERDIRVELLDAIATWQPTAEQMAVIEQREFNLRIEREGRWWMKWFDAIATAKRCAEIGSKAYEQETLGYIVWLLHKRPMRRKANDIFRPEEAL